MAWVTKIDKYSLLGLKKIREYPVIYLDSQQKKCFFWVKTNSEGNKQLELGTNESAKYLHRKSVNRFVIGDYGQFEAEYFYLLKSRDQSWYAYHDDYDIMFRIDDVAHLTYEFIRKLINEFADKTKISKRST